MILQPFPGLHNPNGLINRHVYDTNFQKKRPLFEMYKKLGVTCDGNRPKLIIVNTVTFYILICNISQVIKYISGDSFKSNLMDIPAPPPDFVIIILLNSSNYNI